MTAPTPLGERIRSRRKERNLTLGQLAAAAGCSKSYVWELENKSPPRPSAEKLSGIAAALYTTVDALLGNPASAKSELSDRERIFFRMLRTLPENRKDDIHSMVEMWVRNENEENS